VPLRGKSPKGVTDVATEDEMSERPKKVPTFRKTMCHCEQSEAIQSPCHCEEVAPHRMVRGD
jgi:hypothetical protein